MTQNLCKRGSAPDTVEPWIPCECGETEEAFVDGARQEGHSIDGTPEKNELSGHEVQGLGIAVTVRQDGLRCCEAFDSAPLEQEPQRLAPASRRGHFDRLGVAEFLARLLFALLFGLIVALTGCYQGMQVKGDSEQVGLRTTMAVVQAIFLVIVLDAFFAVFFSNVGWG